MKKITENELKSNVGKSILVIELVSNDDIEIGYDEMWLCDSQKEANENVVEMNKRNTDTNYKYIVVKYNVILDKYGEISLEV